MGKSARSRTLTPRMRATLIVTAVVVALGLAAGAWLLLSPIEAPPTADPSTPAAGPLPGAQPTTGSEVQPPSASTAPDDRIPPRDADVPRISAPLPAPAAAQGALVAGYPSELAAPLDGSDILDTSVATDGDVLQFTLVARSDASGADILAHYGALWASIGLAPASAGNGASSFGDAFSSLTVSADAASGTGTVYTVFGVLRAS
jgi:hypothetical protein